MAYDVGAFIPIAPPPQVQRTEPTALPQRLEPRTAAFYLARDLASSQALTQRNPHNLTWGILRGLSHHTSLNFLKYILPQTSLPRARRSGLASRSGQRPNYPRPAAFSPKDSARGFVLASQSGRRPSCSWAARFIAERFGTPVRALKPRLARVLSTKESRFHPKHVTSTTSRDSALPLLVLILFAIITPPSGKHVGVSLPLSFLPHIAIPFLASLFGP